MIIFDVNKFNGGFKSVLNKVLGLRAVADGLDDSGSNQALTEYYSQAIEGIRAILDQSHEAESLFYELLGFKSVTIKKRVGEASTQYSMSRVSESEPPISDFQYDHSTQQFSGHTDHNDHLNPNGRPSSDNVYVVTFNKAEMRQENEQNAIEAFLKRVNATNASSSTSFYDVFLNGLNDARKPGSIDFSITLQEYKFLLRQETTHNEKLVKIKQAEALAALIDKMKLLEHRIGEDIFKSKNCIGADMKKLTDEMMRCFGDGGYITVKHYQEIYQDYKNMLAELRKMFESSNSNNNSGLHLLEWFENVTGAQEISDADDLFKLETRISKFINEFCQKSLGYKYNLKSSSDGQATFLKSHDQFFATITVFFEVNMCSVSRDAMASVPNFTAPCVINSHDKQKLTDKIKAEFENQKNSATVEVMDGNNQNSRELCVFKTSSNNNVISNMFASLVLRNPKTAQDFFINNAHLAPSNSNATNEAYGQFWSSSGLHPALEGTNNSTSAAATISQRNTATAS